MEKIAYNSKSSNIISIFENEIKIIQTEIDKYDKININHIAVISEPFSGVDYILDKITGNNSQKVNNIKLFSPVKKTDFFTNFHTKKEIILLRNCQYLYTRRCGGFEIFNSFLESISSTDKLFVTVWNKFAWDYLSKISDIENLFPIKIIVPKLDSKTMMHVIMSNIDKKILFTDDRDLSDRQNIWTWKKYTLNIPFVQKKSEIRLFFLNPKALSKKKKVKGMQDTQNEVFLKITKLAEGKYDVAQKIWKKSLKDNEIRLSTIPEQPPEKIPDLDESFILSIILSMESVSYDELLQITGKDISLNQIIFRLINSGLIEESNDEYRINPESVNFIIANLKKNRMVW